MSRLRIGLALALLLAACACPPPAPRAAMESDTWFVEVEGEGGCWLGPETLQALGASPQEESVPTLHLSWAGQEVPCLPLRTRGGWGLFFFAPDRSTRYTRRTAFRVEVGVAGETMASGESPTATASPAGGLVSLHREEDHRYLPQADVGTPWFWEPLYAPGEASYTANLPDALPGPLTVTLHLWSHTAFPDDPDHLLRLKWDGREVGEWEWDGQGMQHLTVSWEEEQPGGEHALTMETPALPGVDVAVVWLDSWDVVYRRRVEPGGAVWLAEGAALHVEEAGPGTRLLDVTEPFAPRDLGTVPTDGMVGTVEGHRYWVGKPEEAPGPLSVRAAERVDLGGLVGVVYLAVAPPDFHAPLQPLLEHRRGQGLEAAVVSHQAVYDTFGDGRPNPESIRGLVQSLPTLRYLLLVGDGTAEPWGYDDEAGTRWVVVPLTRTALLGETPADGLLGTDGEGRPVVAVGRFPATLPDQVAAMVEKTIAWEMAAEPPTALLLSDDEPEFGVLAGEIAVLLPTVVPVRQLDAGDEGSRAQVLAALRDGPVWLNYNGHGSLTLLCDEGILTLEDGGTWREPALVVAWTCLAAHFIHPTQDSMAEAWLRTPQGGAVAFLGPVGETTADEQAPFARAFYQSLVGERRLGDAWLATLQQGGSRDVKWGYLLLGDPALKLLWE